MTRKVVSVAPDTSVLDVATLMVDRGISAIPVISGDSVVGIVSEADLLHRYELGTERDPTAHRWWQRLFGGDEAAPASYVEAHAMKVRDIMTSPVVSVDEDTSVGDVAALFESHNIRRAPVLKAGSVVGIVSRADFVRALVARARIRRDVPPRSDESIRSSLLKELESQSWWRPSLSEVTVTDGVVHISGTFVSPEEKAATRVAAENIPGVLEVQDSRSLFVPPAGYL
jgi:CBS domain-containing protein